MDMTFAHQDQMRRTVLWNGVDYTFKHPKLDEFGEPTDDVEEYTIKGLFHRGSSDWVGTKETDAGSVRSKFTEYITTTWEYAEKIGQKDVVEIKGTKYHVNNVNNINKMSILGQISLEAVV